MIKLLLISCVAVISAQGETRFAAEALQGPLEKGDIAGVVSIFYANGREERSAVGYADLETKRPISGDQIYAQCSQTKGFCGVTIAKLVEDGLLSLDDPIAKYIPEFGKMYIKIAETNSTYRLVPAKTAITIRMCMNHSAGFPFEVPNFSEMGGWSRRMPLKSLALTLAAMPLVYEPGTQYLYSNLGIDMAAAVIERVTGMRWEQYLKKTVFEPLAMTSASFTPSEELLKEHIRGYTILGNADKSFTLHPMEKAAYYPFSDEYVFPSAGAGLWISANDQYKFYKMLFNRGVGDNGARVLKTETVEELLMKPSRPDSIKGTPVSIQGYSLGFKISPDPKTGHRIFGHGGAYSSGCYMDLDRGTLKLVATSILGYNGPAWGDQLEEAAQKFFDYAFDKESSQGVCPPANGVCPQPNGVCPQLKGVCPPTNGVCPPANGVCPQPKGVCPQPMSDASKGETVM